MKQHGKKVGLMLLVLCLLLAQTGCEQGTTETDDTTAQESAATDTAETVPETRDSLPQDLDFGGETVVVYGPTELLVPEYEAEMTGDVVSDALHNRNESVRERLNIDLQFQLSPGLWADESTWKGGVRSAILAGDSAYDIVSGYSIFIVDLTVEKLFTDLSHSTYLDFDQPWWSDTLLDNLMVDDRLYFVTGEISNNLVGTMFGIFFNDTLAADYAVGDLYSLVDEGKWTLDTLFGMTEGVYNDLNGNGKRDEADFYGLYADNTSFDNLYYAAGMSVIAPDDNGDMVISPDFSGEKMVSLLEKLCSAFHEEEGCAYGTEENKHATTAFMEERSLFLMSGVSVAPNSLRDVEFTYGVLPAPKWDEAQADYRSTISYVAALYAIPKDAKDPDLSSAVLEALASESHYTVTPAFYETAMKVKYSADNDSARMYDIMLSSVSYDFGRVYSRSALDGIPGLLRGMVEQNNTNWRSTYAAKEPVLEEKLASLLETLREE